MTSATDSVPELHIEDFLLDEYRLLLKKAKERFQFISYEDHEQDGSVCLWRHDVDISLLGSLQLAKIEAEEGIKSTFFWHLHSEFYNPLTGEAWKIITAIHEMGHYLGLHFDPAYYARIGKTEDLDRLLKLEVDTLNENFDTKVSAISIHTPDVGKECFNISQDRFYGLVNSYGKSIFDNFHYCSDSNGYWRHGRLKEVLDDTEITRLQVLIHPVWWVDKPATPRHRVQNNRKEWAEITLKWYDEWIARSGRLNI